MPSTRSTYLRPGLGDGVRDKLLRRAGRRGDRDLAVVADAGGCKDVGDRVADGRGARLGVSEALRADLGVALRGAERGHLGEGLGDREGDGLDLCVDVGHDVAAAADVLPDIKPCISCMLVYIAVEGGSC